MTFQPSPLKIATMTCISNLNTNINVRVLGKFAKINDIITEIKYRDLIKTKSEIKFNPKQSFYNQITFTVAAGPDFINMKLFPNGQVQMTGCKSIKNVELALQNITQEIYNINNLYSVKVFSENNLLIGYDNTIYSNQNIIGYKLDTNSYIINNEKIVFHNNLLVSNTSYSKQKIKNIYNHLGEIIGSVSLHFYADKRTQNKHTRISNGIIYNTKNEAIGEEQIALTSNTSPSFDTSSIEKIICRFKAAEPNSISINPVQIANINSVYDCNCEINRDSLCTVLNSCHIFSKYDPNTYPGVNIKYIYNPSNTGICTCPTPCRWVNGKPMGLNSCKRISIFVFQSGKIIITGANSSKQLNQTYSFINSLILTHSTSIIQQKIIVPTHCYDNLMRFVD